MAVRIGSWGLPEFGITERISDALGRNRTSQGGSNVIGSYGDAAGSVLGTGTQQIYGINQNQQNYSPAPVQDINRAYSTGSGGSSAQTSAGSSNIDSSGPQFPQPNIQSPSDPFGGGPSEQDVINNEFNAFNSYLDQQESTAQGRFNEAEQLYTGQRDRGVEQYNTERQTQTEGIKKNEALNLKRVRQLLSDLQQSNAARTAITGGGSVSDVLAERFGREAQSRLGNVMDQTQQAITRTNDFYNNAIQKLNDSYQNAIFQAKGVLDENLGQIRLARTQSGAAKQRAQLDAWRNYYDQVNQAKLQAAQFKSQYDLWKQQQDSALSATQGFNESNAGVLNQGIGSSFSDVPQAVGVRQPRQPYDINPIFRVQGKKRDEDDPLQYYQQYGFTPNPEL